LLAVRAAGIWHVTGPALIDRCAFARLAAGAFGLEASLLDPVATAELQQAAARPLRAGLAIDRLRRAFGLDATRSPAEGLADFAASERTVPA
jgi:dTDP-4-dehydrorhamnose reductase